MASLEPLKGDEVHQRSIRIETFSVDPDRVIVEGILEDNRLLPVYTISNQRRDPGPVHVLVVRLLVGGTPATILDAEAEMRLVPMQACREAAESVKRLVGLPIVYGFSKAVKDRLGGTAGCNHLTSLILTMGSAAVQGMAAHRARTPVSPDEGKAIVEYVKDSCWVWREEGEHYREVLEEIRYRKDEQAREGRIHDRPEGHTEGTRAEKEASTCTTPNK